MVENIKNSGNGKDEGKDNFYVTTPIYYVNASPHIGGVYTTLAADVIARWKKVQGYKTFFLTGTDEHGKKIQNTAEEKGKKPQEFVDGIAKEYEELFGSLNLDYDNFIRTSNPEHEEEVKKVLQKLYDDGLIYKGTYESYYCVGCEQYLKERDLVDGKCPAHNKKVELKKEEAYMFKLSEFQDRLLNLIEKDEFKIEPEHRKKEMVSFIKQGLQDVSISRRKEDVEWGVELPFDKEHTCYVWVDAFWNYVTGLKLEGKLDEFWPADVQFMANDILRVHATIWPALVMAMGMKLPKKLFIHGYFTVDGMKMSKSLGNVVDPKEMYEKYGSDSLRYFLMRNIPFGSDGDFSEETLIDRHNNELANKLGNLVSRTAGLIQKKGLKKTENSLLSELETEEIKEKMDSYGFDKALNKIFSFIDKCNEYIQENKPWELGEEESGKILYEIADSIKKFSILLWPFIPETCEKISEQFEDIKIGGGSLKFLEEDFDENSKVEKKGVLFNKMDKSEYLERQKLEKKKDEGNKEKLNKTQKPKVDMVEEGVAKVGFSEWQKLDLRVAEIKSVEDVEGADKLYKMSLDVGELGERTVAAGLKPHYSKEELEGKKIVYFSNLEPKKLKGIESQGMILAATTKSDSGELKVVLLAPEKDIEKGSRVS